MTLIPEFEELAQAFFGEAADLQLSYLKNNWIGFNEFPTRCERELSM